MTQLPVRATISAAWAAAGENLGLLIRLAILPFVAALAIDLLPELARSALAESQADEAVV